MALEANGNNSKIILSKYLDTTGVGFCALCPNGMAVCY